MDESDDPLAAAARPTAAFTPAQLQRLNFVAGLFKVGCAGVVLLCIWACCFGWPILFAALAWMHTAGWRHVPCSIESIGLQIDPGSDEPDSTPTEHLDLTYTYIFNDHRYTGHRFAENESSMDDAGRQRVLQEFRHLPQTWCGINPLHPEQSVLRPTAPIPWK